MTPKIKYIFNFQGKRWHCSTMTPEGLFPPLLTSVLWAWGGLLCDVQLLCVCVCGCACVSWGLIGSWKSHDQNITHTLSLLARLDLCLLLRQCVCAHWMCVREGLCLGVPQCIDGCRMLSSEESSALTSSLNIRHVEADTTTLTQILSSRVWIQLISYYFAKAFSCGDIYEHLAEALIQREQSIIWLHSAVMEIESLLHNRKLTRALHLWFIAVELTKDVLDNLLYVLWFSLLFILAMAFFLVW